MKELFKTLSALRQRGVEIWVAGAELCYQANSAGPTVDELECLRAHKSALIALLGNSPGGAANASSIPHVDRGHPLPSSFAQQRLWFLAQTPSGSQAYHIPLVFRLEGRLDIDSLARAFARLLERHEALRTRFETIGGEAFQRVDKPEEMACLKWDDLSEESDPPARLAALMRDEAVAPFDLEQGPLMRVRLVRLAIQEHALLITLHHIVSDGWSMPVLTRELGELYGVRVKGLRDKTVPLPIQYADYAAWQKQWLNSGVAEAARKYWRKELANAPPFLELPTDRPRPSIQQYDSGIADVVLDKKVTAELNAVARRHGMTLFMVILSAWAIVLSRLSDQSQIVIGSPVANRMRPELEGLIGFFVNTLAHRIDLSGEPVLEDILIRTRETAVGAQEYQELPFEQVVELVNPPRSAAYTPLFQVMLAWQNNETGALDLPGLHVTRIKPPPAAAKFDLMLDVAEANGEVVGELIYATSLFEAETMSRHVGYLQRVLSEIVTSPKKPVAAVDLLSAEERRQLLITWNSTSQPYCNNRCVHQIFEEQVPRSPDRLAVIRDGSGLTYAELNRRANQLARYLRALGTRTDLPVALHVDRKLEMVVALLAVLKAGAAYVPCDPGYPAERLAYMLEDARPGIVLSEDGLKRNLPSEITRVVLLEDALQDASKLSDVNLNCDEIELTPTDLTYVIYTSGSTGRPKGIAMPHSALVNLIEWHASALPLWEGERVLQFAALSFDVAFQETFSTLCGGGTLVLLNEWTRRDPRALTDLLRRESIQRLFVPPLMLQGVADFSEETGARVPSLRDVIVAGEQLRVTPEIRGFFRKHNPCRLHNHYGPTETHVVTTATLPGDPEKWPLLPPIGRPISNTRHYVLDGGLQPVPIGVAGDLYIGGVAVARGYLGRPTLTEERFIRDPFIENLDARLYRTGDIVRYRADGTLHYIGRNDSQIKVRGYRVELAEIEACLLQHKEIKAAAVIARGDAVGGKQLVAYIVRRIGPECQSDSQQELPERLDSQDLRTYLQAILPNYMIPQAFVALHQLPHTPSGKLDQMALPDPDTSAYVQRPYAPPDGQFEVGLAEIWQKLLRTENVGRDDSFFDLGGHSLLAMKLLVKIAERFCVQVSVMSIFQHPVLCHMGKLIQDQSFEGKGAMSPREFDLDDNDL